MKTLSIEKIKNKALVKLSVLLILISFLTPVTVNSQMVDGFSPKLEACCKPIVVGCSWVVKCRAPGTSCNVGGQIPCAEAME